MEKHHKLSQETTISDLTVWLKEPWIPPIKRCMRKGTEVSKKVKYTHNSSVFEGAVIKVIGGMVTIGVVHFGVPSRL